MNSQSLKLMAGEWVLVRSKEEILATLDRKGQLEELPFMPQMFQYCGQKVRVIKRAHRLCDTQFQTDGRAMNDAVVLKACAATAELRWLRMGCVLIWKEAWLRRADEAAGISGTALTTGTGCTEANLLAATALPPSPEAISRGPRYVCQATQLTPVLSRAFPSIRVRARI